MVHQWVAIEYRGVISFYYFEVVVAKGCSVPEDRTLSGLVVDFLVPILADDILKSVQLIPAIARVNQYFSVLCQPLFRLLLHQ